MAREAIELLHDFWYLALPAAQLKPGRMRGIKLLGEPVLLGRAADGGVFALRDICPHRGIPLRHGRFDGQQVTCCYHGWRFATDGRCTKIPSLVTGQDFMPDRIRVRPYPCRELQGNIWVFVGRERSDEEALPPVPQVAGLGENPEQVTLSQDFPCDADQAAFGLMDPTHAAFVHTSWWWKRQARKLRRKEKRFEPTELGWRMLRHRLPPENRVYRLLGKEVTTEITYSLPGLRIEEIRGERHAAASLTAITPIDADNTVVHQSLYWTLPHLAPVKPLLRALAYRFLDQDRRVVIQQQEGLAYDPPLMLVDDADAQAKWFYRLKREWLRARAEQREFKNPIEAKTLSWMS